MPGTYCVTGANGHVASHIILRLLSAGHTIHGTVRNPNDEKRIGWLKQLPGAKDRLKLFALDLNTASEENLVDVMKGCDGAFLVAASLGNKTEDLADAINKIKGANVEGTLVLMRACNKAGVKTVVLTSSGATFAAWQPPWNPEHEWRENEIADAEKWWEQGEQYFASKTWQLTASLKFVEEEKPCFRFCVVHPGVIVGQSLGPEVPATMDAWAAYIWSPEPHLGYPGGDGNNFMGYTCVHDVANMHIACMMNEKASGQYYSQSAYDHNNERLACYKELAVEMGLKLPQLDRKKPFDGPEANFFRCKFDYSRMLSLGVRHRPLKEVYRHAFEEALRLGLFTDEAGAEYAKKYKWPVA